MAEANICIICQESLSTGKSVLTTSCQHTFHMECISKNAKVNNNLCPLCRKSIECFPGTIWIDNERSRDKKSREQTENVNRLAPTFVWIIFQIFFVI